MTVQLPDESATFVVMVPYRQVVGWGLATTDVRREGAAHAKLRVCDATSTTTLTTARSTSWRQATPTPSVAPKRSMGRS